MNIFYERVIFIVCVANIIAWLGLTYQVINGSANSVKVTIWLTAAIVIGLSICILIVIGDVWT